MKKVFFIGIFLAVLGFSTLANADLINNGGNLIYDTDLNITWYAPVPAVMNWAQAISWAASLTVGNTTVGAWRLPTALNPDGSGPAWGAVPDVYGSEMGHLYYTELGNTAGALTNVFPFANLQSAWYWSGTEYAPSPNGAWDFGFDIGYQGVAPQGYYGLYELAVHPGDIGPNGPIPTPIPAAIWLFGAGLVGLVGVRRKFKKERNT